MKFISILAGLALAITPSFLAAQNNRPDPPAEQNHVWNHGEFQAYGDYFHFTQSRSPINFVGLGGRLDFNANPYLALEANMTYDFAQNYTSSSTNGASTSFSRTSVRPLTGLFGPKFQLGTSGPVRAFFTGKVGFINFSTSSKPLTAGTFSGSVNNITGSGTHVALYPGAGVEFFGGPIGFRVDVGDMMYMNNGLNNDLRISGGPAIRF